MGDSEVCHRCKEGLVLYTYDDEDDGSIKYKCILANASTLNCRQTINNNPAQCLECNPNYFYQYGNCVRATYQKIDLAYEKSAYLMLASILSFLVLF